MTKVCPKCKQEKDITHFHKNKDAENGYNWTCKECVKPGVENCVSRNKIKNKNIEPNLCSRLINTWEEYMNKIIGLLVILMGLVYIGPVSAEDVNTVGQQKTAAIRPTQPDVLTVMEQAGEYEIYAYGYTDTMGGSLLCYSSYTTRYRLQLSIQAMQLAISCNKAAIKADKDNILHNLINEHINYEQSQLSNWLDQLSKYNKSFN